LTATCTSCFTTGTVSLESSSFSQDEALLADIPAAIAELAKDPLSFIEEALNVTFALDFQDVSGHFEVDVSFAAAGALSVPLLPPISPVGASVSNLLSLLLNNQSLSLGVYPVADQQQIDGNEIGFIFSIDLVFSVTGEVDVTTGFDITLPNTTSITIDPIKGDIISMDL
jgi:hypothetical protein